MDHPTRSGGRITHHKATGLQGAVVFQVARRIFSKIVVDVLAGLLSANAKCSLKVVGGQPPLPEGDHLDQSVA